LAFCQWYPHHFSNLVRIKIRINIQTISVMKKVKSALVAAGSLAIIGSIAVFGAQAKSSAQDGGENGLGRSGRGTMQGRADGPNGQYAQGEREGLGVMGNVISGTVQSVSGTTLTVLGTGGFGEIRQGSNSNKNVAEKAGTTYTVDAASAMVKRVTFSTGSTNAPSKPTETTIAVSDIAVGDGVRIEGTANGTSIVAKTITDEAGLRNLQAGDNTQRVKEASNNKAQANSLKNELETTKTGSWGKIVSFFSKLFGKKK
jgi:hypothetical protein